MWSPFIKLVPCFARWLKGSSNFLLTQQHHSRCAQPPDGFLLHLRAVRSQPRQLNLETPKQTNAVEDFLRSYERIQYKR